MELPEVIRTVIEAPSFDPMLSQKIIEWVTRSSRFIDYLAVNDTKIASKLTKRRVPTHEDQRDVGTELFCAFALLEGGLNVIPESEGSGPDLKISDDTGEAFVEVRRFREGEETERWRECCFQLRQSLEPLPLGIDIKLGIVGNYENYRSRRYPGLQPPLQAFIDQMPNIERFIRKQIEDPPCEPIKLDIPGLPRGFAKLLVTPHGHGRLAMSFPTEYLKGADRLLDAICEKSKQVLHGSVNVIVFWINNISETFCDFEDAVRKRQQLLDADAGDFCKRHKFIDPSQCEDLWRRCSAFVVSDSELEYPKLWLNPDAAAPLSAKLQTVITDSFKCKF